MGDAPYSEAEVRRLEAVLAQWNAEPLSFAVHVGDITSGRGPCDDAWLEARRAQFARLRLPFVLLPGDNEWTDCHRVGFDPEERLARWRSLFCHPQREIGLVRQASEYCEHVRWEVGGWVFVGVNVPGSNNNLGRAQASDDEHARRMPAVLAWLDEALARAQAARGLVVLFQANPFEPAPRGRPDGYAGLRAWLARAAARMPGRVLVVHGDTHQHRDDSPLPGLRRLEVPGSPTVGWLRIGVGPAGARVELVVP